MTLAIEIVDGGMDGVIEHCEVCEQPEADGRKYTICLPATAVLRERIG